MPTPPERFMKPMCAPEMCIRDSFYIDVVVYPVVNGTYTLTSVTAVAIGG